MEVKKKRFFALSRIERATKLFICLFVFLLINCSSVFASSVSIEKIEEIIQKYNSSWTLNENQITKFEECLSSYNYMSFTKDTRENNLFFIFYNNIPSIDIRNVVTFKECRRLEVNKSSPTSIWDNTYSSINYNFYDTYDWYTESGFYEEGTTNYKVGFEPGATNMDIDFSTYLEPYFVMSANRVGYTTVNNTEINCYYTTSFPRWSNSYSTNREIGSLYIDKNYIIENIFYPAIYINKYNWEQTEEWNYTGYQFFKEGEYDGYLKYSISIDNSILNAPYFYNINLKSVDKNLSEDLNINFAIINENSTGTGGTITNNSGDIISGDATKDKTTIGDILNTLTEPYNPDKNILNTMNSGEILDSMGFEETEKPNQDLWDTLINGFKNVLTENKTIVLEVPLRTQVLEISSNDIKVPDGTVKTFIGLFVNFWLLMKMFTFIRRTIDQINEGNVNVMHMVDADCYFF